MSDTPRTDAAEYESQDEPVAKLGAVDADFARQLERELNRAVSMYRKLDLHTLDLVDRIIRLEAAGDAMERLLPDGTICDKAANLWHKAKEAKP
jgi:hypothetical protein